MEDGGMIKATAELDAINRMRKAKDSGNQISYIVQAEDPSVQDNFRMYFVVNKLTETNNYAEFIGFEADNEVDKKTQLISKKTYEKVNSLANNKKTLLREIKIPWHRVININNVRYQLKNMR